MSGLVMKLAAALTSMSAMVTMMIIDSFEEEELLLLSLLAKKRRKTRRNVRSLSTRRFDETLTSNQTCSPAVEAPQMCGQAAKASQLCGLVSLTQCPSASEAGATASTDSMRSSSLCRLTSAPPAVTVSTIAHAVPTAVAPTSSLSACRLTSRKRKRRIADDDSVVAARMTQLKERREKMCTEFKEFQERFLRLVASPSSPTEDFSKLLADLMENVDAQVHDRLKQNLLYAA